MIIRRIIFASVFFVAVGPAMATGNEIDGFRLGMTIEQAMKVAAEKGYSFRKAIPSSSPNWASYTLSNDGPVAVEGKPDIANVVQWCCFARGKHSTVSRTFARSRGPVGHNQASVRKMKPCRRSLGSHPAIRN